MYKWASAYTFIIGLLLSAFTSKNSLSTVMTQDFSATWYSYVGAQDPINRKDASNYVLSIFQPSCTGGINECCMEMYATLDIMGNPPYHPDFTNITFNGATGMPNGGTDFITNRAKF